MHLTVMLEKMVDLIPEQLHTKNYLKHIIRNPSVPYDFCRKYHKKPETIKLVRRACPLIIQNGYTYRLNRVTNIVHRNFKTNLKPCYIYKPATILEKNKQSKVKYVRTILTDTFISNNRVDIVSINI